MGIPADDPKQRVLQTSKVMRLAGVGRNTLRFYEEMGLIRPSARSAAGYRSYSPEVLDDLSFIKQAKDAGLSLREISELLRMGRSGTTTCGSVSQAIAPKVREIDALMAKLELRKAFLISFVETCGSQPETTRCSVLAKGFTKTACGDV